MPAASSRPGVRWEALGAVAALLASASAAAGCIGHPSLRPLGATCQDVSSPDPAVRREALERFRLQGWMALDRVLTPAEKDLLADCLRRIAPLLSDPNPVQRGLARLLTQSLVAEIGGREADVVVPALVGDVRALWSDAAWQQRLQGLGRRTSAELHTEGGGIAHDDGLRLMEIWLDFERLGVYGAQAAPAEPLLDAILGNADLEHLAREGHVVDQADVERVTNSAGEVKRRIHTPIDATAAPR